MKLLLFFMLSTLSLTAETKKEFIYGDWKYDLEKTIKVTFKDFPKEKLDELKKGLSQIKFKISEKKFIAFYEGRELVENISSIKVENETIIAQGKKEITFTVIDKTHISLKMPGEPAFYLVKLEMKP